MTTVGTRSEASEKSRVAELPLVGGHRAIDLVNTVSPRLPTAGQDHLASPDDLLVWALRTRTVEDDELAAVSEAWKASPAAAGRALSTVKDIREALGTVLGSLVGSTEAPAGTDEALEFLARQWASAAGRTGLMLGGVGLAAAHLAVGLVPVLLVQDRVAYAAVELLVDVDLAHLGTCPVEHGGCGWLFIDNSKNKTRRWCAMDACGAEAKARRLTERRRRQRGGEHAS